MLYKNKFKFKIGIRLLLTVKNMHNTNTELT